MVQGIYKDSFNRKFNPGRDLPRISTDLDSVRTYQFEVHFKNVPGVGGNFSEDLTLAAKQVAGMGVNVDPIIVDRVNDKVYYPGKPTFEELTITFDNLYVRTVAPVLWNWFLTIYDPTTGEIAGTSAPARGRRRGEFKSLALEVVELDNTGSPHAVIKLLGAWPMNVAFSEKNYSTNDFSTLAVKFRYDFIDYASPAV